MEKHQIIRNVKKNKRIASEPGYRDLGAVLLFIFLFPYLISFLFKNTENISGTVTEMEEGSYTVCNSTEAGMEKIPLESYLINRLSSTINMEYEPETLKAQAVVLRTELIREYYNNQKENKCIYVATTLAQVDEKTYEKCKKAVTDTIGMYMTYEGYPIMAPYCAISAGMTRNAKEVFNSEEYPYLKSVRCERDFSAENYMQIIRINKLEFLNQLENICPGISSDINSLDKKDITDMVKVKRDRADYVMDMEIGKNVTSGETFREKFSLNSACFTVEQEKNEILLKTKGVGHGLGLSQFAANEAAKRGSDFIDILNYFFTDIVIEKTE